MRRTVRTLAAPLVARSGDWHSGESGAELGDDGLDVAVNDEDPVRQEGVEGDVEIES
jgi:hypothetical protein